MFIVQTFKYRPYYKCSPKITNPLLDDLDEEDVERNLRLLVDDLNSHFGEVGGVVNYFEDSVIGIAVDLKESACDEIVANHLFDLYLRADKIK